MMNLIEKKMEPCTIIVKTRTSDGCGGFTTTWTTGGTIMAAIVKDSSSLARIAEKQGVSAVYTITTRKGVGLKYPTAIRRESDGKVFRVTSDPEQSPRASLIDIEQVTAEGWVIPTT